MIELKPCPFCGEANPKMRVATDPRDLTDFFYVECANDLCAARMGYARKRDWAVKRWNRRVSDENRKINID